MKVQSHSTNCHDTVKFCKVSAFSLPNPKKTINIVLAIFAAIGAAFAIGCGGKLIHLGWQLYKQSNIWAPAAAMQCGLGVALIVLVPHLIKIALDGFTAPQDGAGQAAPPAAPPPAAPPPAAVRAAAPPAAAPKNGNQP